MHLIEVQRFIDILEKSSIEELKKNKLLTWIKFFTSENLEDIEKELKEANPIMTKAIEEYKRFTSDDKFMRAYAARDAFLVGQKMMLSRERKEGIKEGRLAEQISMAKAMKNKNMDINLISEITGLSIEEVRNLRPD